jgi:hypothetical protein
MFLDLHSHSVSSDDSRATVEQYLKWIQVLRKREYTVDGFVLTEHRKFDSHLDYSRLVMFPLVSVSPGLVRVTALTSTRLQARTAPLMATVPGYRGTRSIGGNSPGRDRRGIHISG